VLLPPPDSFAQRVPRSVAHSLMHVVLHLRGGTIHARLRVVAGIVFPSHPRFPEENEGRRNIFSIRTPGLAELQGLLVFMCKRHSLCRSEAEPVDVHGWHRNLHSKLGVNGLANVHGLKS
jgi:hypothetical protein